MAVTRLIAPQTLSPNLKRNRHLILKLSVQSLHNLFIAQRIGFGLHQNKQLSLVMLVAVFGLALGVAVLLVVLSVVNGFDEALRTRILKLVPHLVLHTKAPASKEDALAGYLAEHEAVVGFAPFAGGIALASSPAAVIGVQVSSLAFENPSQHAFFEQQIEAGGHLPTQPFEVVVGRILAQDLALVVGQNIRLTAPAPRITPLGLFPRTKAFLVVGILATGTELDSHGVFASRLDIRRLFSGHPKTQGWQVRVRDLFAVEELALSFFLRPEADVVGVTHWIQTHGSLYEAIRTQKLIMWLLLSLMIAVASFNVVSSIGSLAIRKKSNIAILMTLGATQRDLVAVFRWLTLLISALGVTLGLLIGTLVATSLDDLYLWFEGVTGLHLMSQYFVDYLPVRIALSDIAIITGLSLALSLLTSFLVAKQSTLVRPAEVLRNA